MNPFWTLAFGFAGLSLVQAVREVRAVLSAASAGGLAALPLVCASLMDFEETIEAGIQPEAARWNALGALPEPWGRLAQGSVIELRDSGSALLPTLRRIRAVAEEHLSSARKAKAQSSQARAQALVCALLVPLIGVTLYILLPPLSAIPWLWTGIVLVALCIAGAGSLWLYQIADDARWCRLPVERRAWPLETRCAYERLIARVRSGVPADMAWEEVLVLLSRGQPSLARLLGEYRARRDPGAEATVMGALRESAMGVQRTIRSASSEGKPCVDRLESHARELSCRLQAVADRELGVLGVRALKPLFICVAPALFGLIAAGIGFGLWTEI